MYVTSPLASPEEDEGCAPAPQLSHCSYTQVIPGCTERQETSLCSGECVSWLPKRATQKSEKSILVYQTSGKVPKLGACPC